MSGVIDTELDRIGGQPETVRSKSMLGSGKSPQESAFFGTKLHRVDVIDALNLQHRADSRSFKLSHAALVDIHLNGIRRVSERAAGSAVQRFKESRPIEFQIFFLTHISSLAGLLKKSATGVLAAFLAAFIEAQRTALSTFRLKDTGRSPTRARPQT
jgi:hypothetical protein